VLLSLRNLLSGCHCQVLADSLMQRTLSCIIFTQRWQVDVAACVYIRCYNNPSHLLCPDTMTAFGHLVLCQLCGRTRHRSTSCTAATDARALCSAVSQASCCCTVHAAVHLYCTKQMSVATHQLRADSAVSEPSRCIATSCATLPPGRCCS
jgi:hypothetical protein